MSFPKTLADITTAVEKVFKTYDVDNSGTLEIDEVVVWMNDTFASMQNQRKVSKQELQKFFNLVDENGDGKLSKEELSTVFKRLAGL
jgi:Ca2+-binding EF-hand superfamily protein